MPDLLSAAVVVGVLILLVLLIVLARAVKVVAPNQFGVLVLFGTYKRTLGPGFHIVPVLGQLIRVDAGGRTEEAGPVAVALAPDRIVNVTARLELRVTDPVRTVFRSPDPYGALRASATAAIGPRLASGSFRPDSPSGWAIAEALRTDLLPEAQRFGIELGRLTLKVADGGNVLEYATRTAS